MKVTNVNKIRTTLLLLIDQEIKTNHSKTLASSIHHCYNNNIAITFNETFSNCTIQDNANEPSSELSSYSETQSNTTPQSYSSLEASIKLKKRQGIKYLRRYSQYLVDFDCQPIRNEIRGKRTVKERAIIFPTGKAKSLQSFAFLN